MGACGMRLLRTGTSHDRSPWISSLSPQCRAHPIPLDRIKFECNLPTLMTNQSRVDANRFGSVCLGVEQKFTNHAAGQWHFRAQTNPRTREVESAAARQNLAAEAYPRLESELVALILSAIDVFHC